METIYIIASVWLGLAVLSAIVASHLRISIALVEIMVGVFAAALINRHWGPGAFGSDLEWVRFLASTGAVLLTFLAGAELDPRVIRTKWQEVLIVGIVGFLAPFLGCAAFARFILHWDPEPVGWRGWRCQLLQWRWFMPLCWKRDLIKRSSAKAF